MASLEAGIGASPWAASNPNRTPKSTPKWDMSFPAKGRSWGSQWSATSHWHDFGNRIIPRRAEHLPRQHPSNGLHRNGIAQVQCRCELPLRRLFESRDVGVSSIGVARCRPTPTPCVELSTSRGFFGDHLDGQPTKLGCGGFERRPVTTFGEHRDPKDARPLERNRDRRR